MSEWTKEQIEKVFVKPVWKKIKPCKTIKSKYIRIYGSASND